MIGIVLSVDWDFFDFSCPKNVMVLVLKCFDFLLLAGIWIVLV